MARLAIMFDSRGLVDESYMDGSVSEHGIYQTYKLALYLFALQAGTYYYGEEDNLFRSQGPDAGLHTGHDQTGTYAGTWENAETTSIAIIVISSLSTTSPFPFPFTTPTMDNLPVHRARSSRDRSCRHDHSLGPEETQIRHSQVALAYFFLVEIVQSTLS